MSCNMLQFRKYQIEYIHIVHVTMNDFYYITRLITKLSTGFHPKKKKLSTGYIRGEDICNIETKA